jgi:hypothetical protein
MSLWNFGNLSAEADQANVKQVEVREGTYAWRIDEILDVKTQAGDQKYQVKMTIVSAEDGSTDLIGTSRNQHFVVGHKKPDVAASYKKDFLAMVRAVGVDLDKITRLGDFLEAIDGIKQSKPIVTYYVKPQEKDPKYLDWRLANKAEAPAQSQPQTVAQQAPQQSDFEAEGDDDLFKGAI